MPLSRDARERIQQATRREIEDLLEGVSVQCYDSETTDELRDALIANVEDGTISPDSLPE